MDRINWPQWIGTSGHLASEWVATLDRNQWPECIGIRIEAYVQQKAPSAYRVFWYYGPGRNRITVVAITPHL